MGECHRGFVLRISVISPTFSVLTEWRESMDHLWFPKYPECSSGLKEVPLFLVIFVCNCACVSMNDWLIY